MDKRQPDEAGINRTPATSDEAEGSAHAPADRAPSGDAVEPNPPRTTKGGITAPKFGSAGSGGAEYEPGSERD